MAIDMPKGRRQQKAQKAGKAKHRAPGGAGTRPHNNQKGAVLKVQAGAEQVQLLLEPELSSSHNGLVARLSPVLSPEDCATLVRVAEQSTSWASQPDSVDGKPEWQQDA